MKVGLIIFLIYLYTVNSRTKWWQNSKVNILTLNILNNKCFQGFNS